MQQQRPKIIRTMRDLIAGKRMRYNGKALVAGDGFSAHEPHANVLVAARLATYAVKAPEAVEPKEPPATPDEVAALRAEYLALAGKKAHTFWRPARLRAEIAALAAKPAA